MQPLSSKVKVKRRFQKAVRVDSDLNNTQALDGYVCSPSATQTLKHMAVQIAETGQGAFTWTGPYGGGKSSLALALASLLGVDLDRRAAARVAIGAKVADQILAKIGGLRGFHQSSDSRQRPQRRAASIGAPPSAVAWSTPCRLTVMDDAMNSRTLYTINRFRPMQPALPPANDRVAPHPSAASRANGKGTRDEEPVEIHRFVDLKAKRKPLRYTVDGIVRRGRVYTTTGPTNAGKTSLWTMAALAVATGRADILNLEVEKGRVAYFAIENPDDTVSRFTIAQSFYRIPNFTLRNRLFIVTVKATPEAVFAALEDLAQSGGFALIVVDTLAAYFDGTDMNDNVAAGNFMRRLRMLSTVLGNPAVVIPAHPIKGADESGLSPYGGGAIVNEVDGNLTLWRRGNACKLHWQTKLRGADFAPVLFRFREYGCNQVRDAKGRCVVMPLLVPLADRPASRSASDRRVLAATSP
jgi:hypothetical protein